MLMRFEISKCQIFSYLNVTGAIGLIGVGALLRAGIVPEKENEIDPKLEVNCALQQKKKK